MVTEEMIRRIPKVELHDHLDGGVRPETIIELAKEYKVELPAQTPDALASWFHRGADRKSLALYLEGFGVTLSVMQTREALERIAFETMEELAKDNVVYAEIRFAPVLHLNQGLNLESVVESVVKGLERGSKATGIRYGLIICAMRHMDAKTSLEMAELAVDFRNRGVVGFDIAGDENGHPPKKHIEAFLYIRRMNFNITIHAGEAFGVESIWQSVQICGAHRIGHATRLKEDMVIQGSRIENMGSLSSFIRDRRIPLEMCLSSNVQTGAAVSLDEHPFHIYYRNDFRVIICTDNRLMSNTSLTKEMHLAVTHYNLSFRDLEKITINSMKSAFLHHDERIRVIYDVLKPKFASIRRELNLMD
ncbi:MAG: adenosine deaminase [Spirochaetales bacterium]|nr:MAG: adenosine deaminase [Spirochaetales bacterium]